VRRGGAGESEEAVTQEERAACEGVNAQSAPRAKPQIVLPETGSGARCGVYDRPPGVGVKEGVASTPLWHTPAFRPDCLRVGVCVGVVWCARNARKIRVARCVCVMRWRRRVRVRCCGVA